MICYLFFKINRTHCKGFINVDQPWNSSKGNNCINAACPQIAGQKDFIPWAYIKGCQSNVDNPCSLYTERQPARKPGGIQERPK